MQLLRCIYSKRVGFNEPYRIRMSCDTFLGLPTNLISYALLTHQIAQVVNMVPGELTWMGGDVHLYSNQIEQVKTQLKREPFPSPTLWLNPEITDLFDFTAKDSKVRNYQHHDVLTAEVAV